MESTNEDAPTATREQDLYDEPEPDYATLVKAGGRKDLLMHRDYIRDETQQAKPYPWVDWFDHIHNSPPPSLDRPCNPHPQNDLLSWPVKDTPTKLPRLSLRQRHRKNTYPPTHSKIAHQKTTNHSNKLPTISSEPLSFTKLLSMDYQKEWIASNNERLRQRRQHQIEKREMQKQKLLEHTMKARQIAGVGRPTEEKPRFIMKRFSNIPSKVNLPKL